MLLDVEYIARLLLTIWSGLYDIADLYQEVALISLVTVIGFLGKYGMPIEHIDNR